MPIYGVRHRVKRTAEGEARPTQVAALHGDGSVRVRELSDERKELEWVSALRSGDTVAMSLGGSGDCLAFAAARVATQVGARVIRIPPHALKAERGGPDKDEDAQLLATLACTRPELFYPVLERERAHILMRECHRAREDAKKARIACQQRIYQRLIGAVYTSPEGLFPEGGIEKAFDAAKANDKVLQALSEEEKARGRELERALEALDVYRVVLKPVKGCGPLIAAPIIAGIGDIRLFRTRGKLRAFTGVGCTADGQFRRRKKGEIANWNTGVRHGLFNLWDQMNRRPESPWGIRFLEEKRRLRGLHPVPVEENGKTRWSDGHVHRCARWYVLGYFVDHLFDAWWELERSYAR